MLLKTPVFVMLLVSISTLSAFNFFTPCGENCKRCHPCRCEKNAKKDEDAIEVVDVDKFDEECANHMNESSVNGYCSGFKHVYNPFKDIIRRKSVLPVCVRCAQCLAISAEVRKMFEKIIRANERNAHLEPSSARCAVDEEFTADFCKRTFTSHDLRVCNGRTQFAKLGECGTHLRTEFDGQWPTMFRNMCLLFVQQLDAASKYSFFHQFLMGLKTTDDILCRGDGVFRECKNLVSESFVCNTTVDEPKSFWISCLLQHKIL